MWIVRLALRRPYTFTVMALLIVVLGALSAYKMAKDIFPPIDIPVVVVIWQYNGLPPDEIAERIVTVSERAMTTTVNDIEHMESQSFTGVGVIKVFFHPGTSIDAAVAQVTSINQTIIKILPPGGTPPLIVRFNASNVPILQLGIGSRTLPEQALFDLGLNTVRVELAVVQGASVPLPFGGKVRQIMVDLDLKALESKGLSPSDVTAALAAQNLTLPSGTAKIGDREYEVTINGSPGTVAELGDLPLKRVNGAMVYIRDVAQVRDGFVPQTNIVRQDGIRGALVTVLKSGSASTLDVINRVKAALPHVRSVLPPDITLNAEFDQSVFVRAALVGVLKEATLAAALTAAMILLFLGTWRNTLVVIVSIPLSICCSVICLYALGQTINAMTLGGLALAVGILVDDATVEIENIDRNLHMGKVLVRAILDGAQQIAVPAFVSTLCICIVFVPIFFLSGTAKFLFGPLAMAVIFAMLASYFLSRTVVPTFVHYLLLGKPVLHDDGKGHADAGDLFWRIHVRFNRHFERFRSAYTSLLESCLKHRGRMGAGMLAIVVVSACLIPVLGRDFFPIVDAGQFRLHVRAPDGTRIEETEHYFTRVEDVIRSVIPKDELATIIDDIGLPNGGTGLAFSDTATVGTLDGEILVALKREHGATWGYVRKIRERLNRELPNCTFFTQPSDMVGQILNFGLPAPIDLQISGPPRNAKQNYALIQELAARVARIRGAVDVHVHQVVNAPALAIEVDRTRADEIGLTQADVAGNVLVSLAGTTQVAPSFWLSPQGVQYFVGAQVPQRELDSVDALKALPVGVSGPGRTPELLGNVATIRRTVAQQVIGHYNVQPVFDVYANVDGRDLGRVATDVRRLLPEIEGRLPIGSVLKLRGQVQSMDDSFLGIGIGILFAVGLVYFLMVVNFQSWLDPLIIIMALPGALCGVVWILFLTRTTLSVPSLMGAIMSVGVATSNSILMITFANDMRHEGRDAQQAALEAGHTRLRPVLMTALAMIIGMLPMALGFGEGGEQNAPLGRAVIGGLLVATVATLLFVPVVYASLRTKPGHSPDEELAEELDSTPT
jgi:multidrug efflux pump subunit AcrB